ncbi:nicotinate-nucleotide adenylyltransferase [Terrimonas alba]|uniref:nicotinate-nucleotide adenylyltransferase n=1 Tax=Terrimonas alba TaxID=3349636 RepID=UPI0035F35B8A
MKQIKLAFIIGILSGGFVFQSASQETLPEVKVVAVRYKYLMSVDNKDLAQPVKLLERQAATFDVKSSEYYQDDYDNYFISFFIPEGQILAAYDKDGKLLHTAEKYKNVALPAVVRQSVTTRFPGWVIAKDFYVVSYEEAKGSRKVYKILLENGDKRIKVKTNDKGEFLD